MSSFLAKDYQQNFVRDRHRTAKAGAIRTATNGYLSD